MSNKKGRPEAIIDLEAFARLAAIQCTQTEIASFFDVSVDTIQRRIADDSRFADAWDHGREKGRVSLRRMQFESASKGNVAMQIWLGKQYLGQREPESDAYVSPGTNIRLFVNQAGMDHEVDADPPTPEGKVRSKVREA